MKHQNLVNNLVAIYGLACPIYQQVRYVGKSVNPINRYGSHFKDKYNANKYIWISKLLENNLKPNLIILEFCIENEWEEKERFWINYFKSLGIQLFNIFEGGYGASVGHSVSLETKQKLRLANLGKKQSQETIEKRAMHLRGKKRPKSMGEKLSICFRGENSSTAKLKEATVIKIRELSHQYYIPQVCAIFPNINRGTITDIILYKTWKYLGKPDWDKIKYPAPRTGKIAWNKGIIGKNSHSYGRIVSNNTRNKISKSLMNHLVSEETIQKMSQKIQQQYDSGERVPYWLGKKRSKSIKGNK